MSAAELHNAGSFRGASLLKWMAALAAPIALILLFDALLGTGTRYDTGWRATTLKVIESPASDPTDLPSDGWRPMRIGDSSKATSSPTSVWFRVDFDVAAPGKDPWAVYIVRSYANVAVFVNGNAIGDGGPMRRPLPLHRTPLLFQFSSGLLQSGSNVVLIHAMAEASKYGAVNVHVGPSSDIEPSYAFMKFMLLTIKQVSVIALFAMSLVMGALFLMRRRDTTFGWFALGLACWAAHISLLLVTQTPIVLSLWTNLNGIALGAFVLSAMHFVNRFIGRRDVLVERIAVLFWTLTSAILVVDSGLLGYRLPTFFKLVVNPGIIAMGVYMVWQLVRANRLEPEPELRWLAFAAWVVLAVGIRDAFVDVDIIRYQALYLTYTVGIVLFVFGLIMLRRFIRALNVAERARDDLELRVAEKSRELEINLGRIKDMEREHALSAERERLMRDMHDGVGGQLAQALAVAANDPQLRTMEEPLRGCLEELRLIIDSMEPVDGDLASVLGTLRVRLKKRLNAAGIKILWQVEDLPHLNDFGPHKVLQVSRIIQEAITNILKHSGADLITLSAKAVTVEGSSRIEIAVLDNGRGFDDSKGVGRGLENMRRRAKDIGGEVNIETGDWGVRVVLNLSIPNS